MKYGEADDPSAFPIVFGGSEFISFGHGLLSYMQRVAHEIRISAKSPNRIVEF